MEALRLRSSAAKLALPTLLEGRLYDLVRRPLPLLLELVERLVDLVGCLLVEDTLPALELVVRGSGVLEAEAGELAPLLQHALQVPPEEVQRRDALRHVLRVVLRPGQLELLQQRGLLAGQIGVEPRFAQAAPNRLSGFLASAEFLFLFHFLRELLLCCGRLVLRLDNRHNNFVQLVGLALEELLGRNIQQFPLLRALPHIVASARRAEPCLVAHEEAIAGVDCLFDRLPLLLFLSLEAEFGRRRQLLGRELRRRLCDWACRWRLYARLSQLLWPGRAERRRLRNEVGQLDLRLLVRSHHLVRGLHV